MKLRGRKLFRARMAFYMNNKGYSKAGAYTKVKRQFNRGRNGGSSARRSNASGLSSL